MNLKKLWNDFKYGKPSEEMNENGGQDEKYHVAWHQSDNWLLTHIMEIWPKNKHIVDLGCGSNYYCNVLRHYGWSCQGYDYTPFDGNGRFIDLTKPQKLKSANVISLEVGEHIDEKYQDVYLDNICQPGGDIIMSWALPDQAGIGHINCRSNEWVIEQMGKRGYKLQENRTRQLRSVVHQSHCTWFRNTIMYFVK